MSSQQHGEVNWEQICDSNWGKAQHDRDLTDFSRSGFSNIHTYNLSHDRSKVIVWFMEGFRFRRVSNGLCFCFSRTYGFTHDQYFAC